MCGIVCVAGNKNSLINCYKALEKLEYRGYDSAGIAGIKNEKIFISKKEGSVSNLYECVNNEISNISISHTRWATHGKPTRKNAHPHISCDKNFALVHNGIIDNYLEIKKDLEKNGVKFLSSTDSECIVNLYAKNSGDVLERVKLTRQKLKGSYAVGILDKENKQIIAFRQKSPLFIAKTSKGTMVASDIICFSGIAKEYYMLKETDIIIIKDDGTIKFYNEQVEYFPKFTTLKNIDCEISKGEYETYMEKEINEIPLVLERLIYNYEHNNIDNKVIGLFKDIKNIKLIGCGTAYHAALYGARILEKKLKIASEAYIASEFKYANHIIKENTLAIFISQSGETADTIGCAEQLKEKNVKTLAITNVKHSLLAKICDENINIFAGREVAVASTKAYVAQIFTLYILANILNQSVCFEKLKMLPNLAKQVIKIDDNIVSQITKEERTFFIGRGYDCITAKEASLKLKEISYKSSEGYPAGELKHGTIALINKGTPVIVIATEKNLRSKTLSNLEEVKSRGAFIVLLSNKEKMDDVDCGIYMPEIFDEDLYPILSIIPLQLLSFKVSKSLGLNPDKPKNLAKSVTVE